MNYGSLLLYLPEKKKRRVVGSLFGDGGPFCAIAVYGFQMLTGIDPLPCGALQKITEAITGCE